MQCTVCNDTDFCLWLGRQQNGRKLKEKEINVQGHSSPCTCTHTAGSNTSVWARGPLRTYNPFRWGWRQVLLNCFIVVCSLTWYQQRKLFKFAPFCPSTLPTASLYDFVPKHFMLEELKREQDRDRRREKKRGGERKHGQENVCSVCKKYTALTSVCYSNIFMLVEGICSEIMIPLRSHGSSEGINGTFTHTICKEARLGRPDVTIHTQCFPFIMAHILLMNIILLGKKKFGHLMLNKGCNGHTQQSCVRVRVCVWKTSFSVTTTE